MKYKTTVDAVQWDGENIKEIAKFIKYAQSIDLENSFKDCQLFYRIDDYSLSISFPSGYKGLVLYVGEYFILDNEDRVYSKTEAEFKEQYQGVECE